MVRRFISVIEKFDRLYCSDRGNTHGDFTRMVFKGSVRGWRLRVDKKRPKVKTNRRPILVNDRQLVVEIVGGVHTWNEREFSGAT